MAVKGKSGEGKNLLPDDQRKLVYNGISAFFFLFLLLYIISVLVDLNNRFLSC